MLSDKSNLTPPINFVHEYKYKYKLCTKLIGGGGEGGVQKSFSRKLPQVILCPPPMDVEYATSQKHETRMTTL